MEQVDQIKQIAIETNNQWFLTHDIVKIALVDLKVKTEWEGIWKEEGVNADEVTCTCNIEDTKDICCYYCEIETDRHLQIEELKLSKSQNGIYDFKKNEYTKTRWITHVIDGKIKGFMLIKCDGSIFQNKEFTHELIFACVSTKYRQMGILTDMLSIIPTEWKVWLEATSNEIPNVETVWEKCGFSYYGRIEGGIGNMYNPQLIYQKRT